ncbi:MAG: DUF6489 family protein [Panacagrimonas sp.]
MQIKIEIDVKPEELRRFLGLPDVGGLQDDLIHFLRDKVEQVNEGFNPTDFVKENIDTLKKTGAWQKIKSRINLMEEEAASPPPKKTTRPRPKPKTTKRPAQKPKP